MTYREGYLMPNLIRMIGRHTVLIFNKTSKKIGTGLLVMKDEHLYAFTAKHLIEDTDPDSVVISFGPPTTDVLPKKFHPHDKFDISLISLDPRHHYYYDVITTPYESRKRCFVEIPYENLPDIRFCGVGLPTERATFDQTSNTLRVGSLFFSGSPLKELPPRLSHIAYDNNNEIWIDMTGDFIDENGNLTEFTVSPKGISGCAIWFYDPSTMDADKPLYTLIGIQSAALIESRYLRIVHADHLFKMMAELQR